MVDMSTISLYIAHMKNKRRLIYQINQARHAMMKSLDTDCHAELGISATQLSCLMVLKENPNCLMKDLAHILMLDKSAITGMAKRMIASDLIEKVPCHLDSRASRLNLTPSGKVILAKGVQHLMGVNQQMEQGFSEAELETVSRFLTHLTTTFSNG